MGGGRDQGQPQASGVAMEEKDDGKNDASASDDGHE